ncbi:MAG: type II secretion system protein [Burkholderiales bacterium]
MSRCMTGPRGIRGFTLAELVVVILILGILAVVAVPRLATTSDFEVQGVYDQALSTVRYAQKVAIASRSTVRVAFAANAVSVCFDGGGACGSAVTDPVRNGSLRAAGSSTVTLTGTTFTYDGLGRPSPGPVTVSVSGGGLTRTFTVEAETGHAHP